MPDSRQLFRLIRCLERLKNAITETNDNLAQNKIK
jgi:hypothetical protein